MLKFTVEPVDPKDTDIAKTMETVMNHMATSGEFDAIADKLFDEGLAEFLETGSFELQNYTVHNSQ